MDLVTHSLVGVALSRAGFRRVTPNATLLLILATTIPDIDILSLAGGQLADLEYHRGYTHTFIALPLLGLLCVALTAVIGTQKLRLFSAWVIACIGIASHILLDWTGSFGIRPFLPFSSRWYFLDLNGSYDGIFLISLLLALVWPWFVNLVSGEIGRIQKQRGQGSAIAVLLFLLLYEGGRWSLHEHVLNDLNSRLFNDQVPLDVSALPEPNNPFEWIGIIETQDAFRIVKTSSLEIGNASDSRVFIKPDPSVAYLAAMQTPSFRYMSYFSRFPVWGIQPVPLGSRVGKLLDLTDLRFGTPGEGEFHAFALTDNRGRVLVSDFGFSTMELEALEQSLSP